MPMSRLAFPIRACGWAVAALTLGAGTALAQAPANPPPPKTAAPAAGAAKTADPIFWYNVPASPLAIERREIPADLKAKYGSSWWLGLANRSSQRVIRYDVGCVVEDQGRVKVMSTLFWVAISEGGAAPGHFSPGIFRHGDPAQDELDAASACKGSRLAVVQVGLGDGTLWSARGAIWAERKDLVPEANQ